MATNKYTKTYVQKKVRHAVKPNEQNATDPTIKQGYECSQCGQVEDRIHMFQCQSHKMRKERKHGWRLLKKK